MLFKLLLMRLLLRAKRVSQYLTLLCQIVMITLDILVGGHDSHDSHDSDDGNMEMEQEDFVEGFNDPGVNELDLMLREIDEDYDDDDEERELEEEDVTKMFKCSKCGNSFITTCHSLRTQYM